MVLWGVSLGGASSVLAAAGDPGVAGIICDSSFRDLRDTVAHHITLFRGFRWWLSIVPAWPVTVTLASRFAGLLEFGVVSGGRWWRWARRVVLRPRGQWNHACQASDGDH